MSSRQSWLKRTDWQQEISALEDRASMETLFVCLQNSVEQANTGEAKSVEAYLENLFGLIQGHLGCQGIGVFRRESQWKPVIKLGGRSLGQPEADWLDEVSLRESCGFVADVPATGWGQIACPLRASIEGFSWEMLVISGRYIREDSLTTVAMLVHFLEQIWQLLDLSRSAKSEAAMLARLCGDFTSLLQAKTLQQLLELLAQQSTSLLSCERATIFIHDTRLKQLVGSPATGLNGESLIVPEDAGIVGEVVQSGKILSINDVYVDPRFENQIDQQTGFQTRNILCVPLLDETETIIGAFECLNKREGDFSERDQRLLELLSRHAAISIQQTQTEQELQRRHRDLQSEKCSQCELIGESAAIKAIRSHVLRLCSSDLPVLIIGETGTGKETIARALHYRGSRSEKPFVVINCAEIKQAPPEIEQCLLEEEIRQAEGGTLFLDDIDSLSLENQEKLLGLLEQGAATTPGKSKAISLTPRIVAATQSRLTDQILEGKFLEELYYRLAVVSIDLPALRERPDDIAPLLNYFLENYRRQAKRPALVCSSQVIEKFLEYSWPGNVRELKSMMERLAFVAHCDEISPEDIAILCGLEAEGSGQQNTEGLTEATLDFQQRYIRHAIAKARGNMTAAARLLGLHRSNLYRKMRQLKMAEAKEEPGEER